MKAPEAVANTYRKLKARFPFYVQLMKVNGRFYVYRRTSHRDETGKVKTSSQYMGRIDFEGNFIEKMTTNEIAGIKERMADKIRIMEHLHNTDLVILTNLSMNCRMPLSIIAERTGLATQSITHRINKLEQLFGIRYFTSIDYRKFGFSFYVALVKFFGEVPREQEIMSMLEKHPKIQLALSTSGDYDLFIFFLAENNEDAGSVIASMRSDVNIYRYKAKWHVTFFYNTYGHIPIRDLFFESVLKKRVWHRTRRGVEDTLGSMSEREFIVLRELCKNGRQPFSEIDRRNKLGNGAAAYTFEKLRGRGLVYQSTLLMHNTWAKYNSIIIARILDYYSFSKSRRKLFEQIILEGKGPVNRFTLVGDFGAPQGGLFVYPVFDDNDLEGELEILTSKVGGIKVNKFVITKVLIGELCHKRSDNAYSSQYEMLIRDYENKIVGNRIEYEDL